MIYTLCCYTREKERPILALYYYYCYYTLDAIAEQGKIRGHYDCQMAFIVCCYYYTKMAFFSLTAAPATADTSVLGLGDAAVWRKKLFKKLNLVSDII